MAAQAETWAARLGRGRAGTEAAVFMMPMSRPYRKSDTRIAAGIAGGKIEHKRPAPMPHHIVAVTRGAAAIEAGIPAS